MQMAFGTLMDTSAKMAHLASKITGLLGYSDMGTKCMRGRNDVVEDELLEGTAK